MQLVFSSKCQLVYTFFRVEVLQLEIKVLLVGLVEKCKVFFEETWLFWIQKLEIFPLPMSPN